MANENVETSLVEEQTEEEEEEQQQQQDNPDPDQDTETIEDFPPLPEGYEEAFAPDEEDGDADGEQTDDEPAEAVGSCQRISLDEFHRESRAYTDRMLQAAGLFEKHSQSVRRTLAKRKKTIFQVSLIAILAITFVSLIILSPWKNHLRSDAAEAPIIEDLLQHHAPATTATSAKTGLDTAAGQANLDEAAKHSAHTDPTGHQPGGDAQANGAGSTQQASQADAAQVE